MSCKNEGRCICGKEEYYLFTPHLTEEERLKLSGITLLDKEPNYIDNIVDEGWYQVRGSKDLIHVSRPWGIVTIKDLQWEDGERII